MGTGFSGTYRIYIKRLKNRKKNCIILPITTKEDL